MQRTKRGLMRKQLRKRNFFLTGLGKLRPELCDSLVYVDVVFLQCMQKTRAAHTLCCRPNEDECVIPPQFFATRVAKPTVKIDNRLSISPDRHGGAQFAELLEIFPEQQFQSFAKFSRLELHRGTQGAAVSSPPSQKAGLEPAHAVQSTLRTSSLSYKMYSQLCSRALAGFLRIYRTQFAKCFSSR